MSQSKLVFLYLGYISESLELILWALKIPPKAILCRRGEESPIHAHLLQLCSMARFMLSYGITGSIPWEYWPRPQNIIISELKQNPDTPCHVSGIICEIKTLPVLQTVWNVTKKVVLFHQRTLRRINFTFGGQFSLSTIHFLSQHTC